MLHNSRILFQIQIFSISIYFISKLSKRIHTKLLDCLLVIEKGGTGESNYAKHELNYFIYFYHTLFFTLI